MLEAGGLEDPENLKIAILKKSTQFNLYCTILSTIPSVFWCLFLGSWCDVYSNGRKVLMIYGSIGSAIETIIILLMVIYFKTSYTLLLISCLPSTFGAGIISCLTAALSYQTITSTPESRPTKFMIFEVFLLIASLLAEVIGAYALSCTPWLISGQLHNYSGVLLIAFSGFCLSIFWALFAINQTKEVQYDDRSKQTGPQKSNEESILKSKTKISPILMIFNLRNVREVWLTCTKKRENNKRMQLWLIIISMAFLMLLSIGPQSIMFQFAQRVYLWNIQEYNYIDAIVIIIKSIGTGIATLFLLKLLKISDLSMAMVGIISCFISSLLMALVLNMTGYIVSTIVGSISNISSVGTRTYLSKIVEKEEFGKVFSLIAALDSTTPLIANTLFAVIFNSSIALFPGLVFIIAAFMFSIPFFILIWIRIRYKNTLNESCGLKITSDSVYESTKL